MTTQYAADHTSALADIQAAGAAVTFTRSALTQDPTSGEPSTTVKTTVTGYAVAVKGNPVEYAALGLTQMEALTLVFAPTTLGANPALGASVTWGGTVYVLKSVNGVAPDGTSLIARVVIAR